MTGTAATIVVAELERPRPHRATPRSGDEINVAACIIIDGGKPSFSAMSISATRRKERRNEFIGPPAQRKGRGPTYRLSRCIPEEPKGCPVDRSAAPWVHLWSVCTPSRGRWPLCPEDPRVREDKHAYQAPRLTSLTWNRARLRCNGSGRLRRDRKSVV